MQKIGVRKTQKNKVLLAIGLDLGVRGGSRGSRRLGAPKEMVLGCWVPGSPKLGYWRLRDWRLPGLRAKAWRLGFDWVIAGLVVV